MERILSATFTLISPKFCTLLNVTVVIEFSTGVAWLLQILRGMIFFAVY